MIMSYMMPTLPSVVSLGIHSKLTVLWRRIGGRLPTGAKGTPIFKKSDILKKAMNKPTWKNGRKTNYF